jgi:hypothetical protein
LHQRQTVKVESVSLERVVEKCVNERQCSVALERRAESLMLRAQVATVRSFDLCLEAHYLCLDRTYPEERTS